MLLKPFAPTKKTGWFYFLIVLGLVSVLFTHPFLRYPYDMIHHLMVIDDLYMQMVHPVRKLVGIGMDDVYSMISTGEYEPIVLQRARFIWHYFWAELFVWMDIDSTQMFLRAKIIHVVQTCISVFSLYYFSKVAIRNTFKTIDVHTIQWLALWSVVIWLSIFATFSAAYHQVWMMWYSVNYQITLPLFWYMTALTLVLLLEETTWKIKLFFVLQILLLARFILQAHSMEFMYYLMYLLVFSVVFVDKIFYFVKKYYYIFLVLVGMVYYFIMHFQPEHSRIFDYLSIARLPVLYEDIMAQGEVLLRGYNRASASVNELMVVSLGMGTVMLLWVIGSKLKRKENSINMRMLVFVGISSLFVLIPVFQFTGGLFGILTDTMVVNRLYYSASLFVLIPISICMLSMRYQWKLRTMNLWIFGILLGVAVFSKHVDILHHNYYKNIKSIGNSFNERKVGFNLSSEQIEQIGKILKQYESDIKINQKIYYFARADIAFVIKYMYKRKVYWEGRRENPQYEKIYEKRKRSRDYKYILFEVPEEFPVYHPYG